MSTHPKWATMRYVDAQNANSYLQLGFTPMHIAARKGNLEVARANGSVRFTFEVLGFG